MRIRNLSEKLRAHVERLGVHRYDWRDLHAAQWCAEELNMPADLVEILNHYCNCSISWPIVTQRIDKWLRGLDVQ